MKTQHITIICLLLVIALQIVLVTDSASDNLANTQRQVYNELNKLNKIHNEYNAARKIYETEIQAIRAKKDSSKATLDSLHNINMHKPLPIFKDIWANHAKQDRTSNSWAIRGH